MAFTYYSSAILVMTSALEQDFRHDLCEGIPEEEVPKLKVELPLK